MNYKEAQKELNKQLDKAKPRSKRQELLSKSLQAVNDCLEMGLDGEGE